MQLLFNCVFLGQLVLFVAQYTCGFLLLQDISNHSSEYVQCLSLIDFSIFCSHRQAFILTSSFIIINKCRLLR